MEDLNTKIENTHQEIIPIPNQIIIMNNENIENKKQKVLEIIFNVHIYLDKYIKVNLLKKEIYFVDVSPYNNIHTFMTFANNIDFNLIKKIKQFHFITCLFCHKILEININKNISKHYQSYCTYECYVDYNNTNNNTINNFMGKKRNRINKNYTNKKYL
jgi:hypothetical protein